MTVAICHCDFCQKRTGSVFQVGAYFPADEPIEVRGETKAYNGLEIDGVGNAAGASVTYNFCPTCGSTVYWVSVAKQASSESPPATSWALSCLPPAWSSTRRTAMAGCLLPSALNSSRSPGGAEVRGWQAGFLMPPLPALMWDIRGRIGTHQSRGGRLEVVDRRVSAWRYSVPPSCLRCLPGDQPRSGVREGGTRCRWGQRRGRGRWVGARRGVPGPAGREKGLKGRRPQAFRHASQTELYCTIPSGVGLPSQLCPARMCRPGEREMPTYRQRSGAAVTNPRFLVGPAASETAQ